MRPKIVKLIDRYSTKITELKTMNDKFVHARGTFDEMMVRYFLSFGCSIPSTQLFVHSCRNKAWRGTTLAINRGRTIFALGQNLCSRTAAHLILTKRVEQPGLKAGLPRSPTPGHNQAQVLLLKLDSRTPTRNGTTLR